MNNAWLLLIVAGICEVGWAISLKYTNGLDLRGRPLACAITLASLVASMYLLALAVRAIPIGTGYAIWTGIGAIGTATLGMILFREPATAARIACLLLVVIGMVGLKFTSSTMAAAPNAQEKIAMYIGGYASAKNKGIYRVELNAADGTLSAPTLAIEAKDASFLALNPTLPVLYAAGEAGKPDGTVKAFHINEDGTLTSLGDRSSMGAGPCYVSVDREARLLLTANYGDGVVAAFPIAENGALGEASFSDTHVGKSVVANRQGEPHAHSFLADPAGHFALSADLGTDEIVIYKIDAAHLSRVGATKVPPGSGPRHIAFSLDGKFAYICNELSNTLATFSWDSASGVLALIDTQSTLPPDFKGESYCAEVAMHPSGRFLYVSNRGHDTIAVFALDLATGHGKPVGHVSTGGHWPRHFAIDPSGRFLVVANQRSDSLVAFKIDPTTGMPTPTGSTADIGTPSCVRFLR